MARSIMIQGTMSNAGKSFVAAGFLLIFTVTVFFVPLLKVTSTFSVAVLPEKLLLAVSVRVLESAESFRERRPLRLTAFLM